MQGVPRAQRVSVQLATSKERAAKVRFVHVVLAVQVRGLCTRLLTFPRVIMRCTHHRILKICHRADTPGMVAASHIHAMLWYCGFKKCTSGARHFLLHAILLNYIAIASEQSVSRLLHVNRSAESCIHRQNRFCTLRIATTYWWQLRCCTMGTWGARPSCPVRYYAIGWTKRGLSRG